MSPYEQSLAERKINRWKRERPPALCVWHSEPHPVKRTEKKYKVFPAGSHVLLAAFYTVTKGTKLSENRTVIKKLSFEIPQAGSLIFAYCDANFALPGRPLWLQRCDFRTAENPFLLTTAAQILRCRGVLFGYSGAIFGRLRIPFY